MNALNARVRNEVVTLVGNKELYESNAGGKGGVICSEKVQKHLSICVTGSMSVF